MISKYFYGFAVFLSQASVFNKNFKNNFKNIKNIYWNWKTFNAIASLSIEVDSQKINSINVWDKRGRGDQGDHRLDHQPPPLVIIIDKLPENENIDKGGIQNGKKSVKNSTHSKVRLG